MVAMCDCGVEREPPARARLPAPGSVRPAPGARRFTRRRNGRRCPLLPYRSSACTLSSTDAVHCVNACASVAPSPSPFDGHTCEMSHAPPGRIPTDGPSGGRDDHTALAPPPCRPAHAPCHGLRAPSSWPGSHPGCHDRAIPMALCGTASGARAQRQRGPGGTDLPPHSANPTRPLRSLLHHTHLARPDSDNGITLVQTPAPRRCGCMWCLRLALQ